MYLLIVYDIKAKRVNKVKNFLRQNLFWVQNSVFEGEVSEKEYNFIKNSLYKNTMKCSLKKIYAFNVNAFNVNAFNVIYDPQLIHFKITLGM